MQVRVQCPACKASFEVPAALVGRDGECSQCQKVFRVTPLSGEVDRSVLTSGDSAATLEMPIVDDDRPAADTDEFEIPDISDTQQPVTEDSSPELDVPALEIPDVPELAIPEPDIPAAKEPRQQTGSKKKTSEADLPAFDTETDNVSEEQPPILVEDDGSLFGDELPELEDVPEPVSRYASEDEVDPDAGGSYSLSGSAPTADNPQASERRRAKKARRKKTAKKKTSTRRNATEGDSRATSDHELEASEVELFDDVLHDDDEEDVARNTSPIMLRRSGTFSTPGKSAGKSRKQSDDSSVDAPAKKSPKRAKRRPAVREGKSDPGARRPDKKPVLKRRSTEERPAPSRSESEPAPERPARKKSEPMSPESRQKLIRMAGVGAALLVLAAVFSHLTSGPPVITPTVQNSGGSFSNQPQGPAPVPNQNGDSIQTGDTNSSVARANRIRGSASPPRRVDGSKEGTDETSGPTDQAPSDGTTESESESTGTQVPDGFTVVAAPVVESNDATDTGLGNLQTDDDELFPLDSVAIPTFPNLGTSMASTAVGVVYHEIAIGSTRTPAADDDPVPGSQMDMILYLPNGSHKQGSLPCVMIAAAGTTLLEGNGCYDESYQAETIPYVKQGFAVLGYSLDGPLASDSPTKRESKEAYEQFRAAHAGLVNSRNALEFLLQKVPAINRDRIFTAGHSSAGTLSLLFAEHESRLAGCIAYAPSIDVEKRLSDYISNPLVEILLPDVAQFVRQESPLRHYKSLKCPVLLFHAEGDTNAPFEETQKFADLLTAQGTPCKIESVPDGDHYQSMLEDGIPRGTNWLKSVVNPDSPGATTPIDGETKSRATPPQSNSN